MDLTTALEVGAALVAAIQKAIAIHDAAVAGTIAPADAIAQLNGLIATATTDEATNQASALAEEKLRGVLP